MTVLAAILEKAPRMEIGQARSFLGRFLFSGDDVAKPIASLSGGQRSRVALARLTLEGANLLLLDEPTNHLDIQSQEVLEDVLRSFPGTVLLVTHDRYLVEAVAARSDDRRPAGRTASLSGQLQRLPCRSSSRAGGPGRGGGSGCHPPDNAPNSRRTASAGREDRRQRKAAEQQHAQAKPIGSCA